MTRPQGSTSDSEPGDSQLAGQSLNDTARANRADGAGAAGAAGAADEPVPVTDDVLDARDRRQARGRKKPGPTRKPPANPPTSTTDAPPTEI